MKRVYVNESARVVVTVLDDSDGRYVGKARCNPADQWDEAIGREISLRRAQVKMLQAKARRLDAEAQKHCDLMEKFDAKLDKLFNRIRATKRVIRFAADSCATPAAAGDE